MRREVWIVIALALLVAALAGADSAADKDAPTLVVAHKYLPVSLDELNQGRSRFVGQRLEVKDVFDRPLPEFPAAFERAGIKAAEYAAFDTHPIDGGSLRCAVARENEMAKAVFARPLVRGTPILLRGRLGETVAGRSLFLVEEIYRGWEAQGQETQFNITVKLSASAEGKEYTYKIPELNKKYAVTCPGIRQPIYIRVLKEEVDAKK